MFKSSNGIRQADILSHYLYDVHTDDFIVIIDREDVKCFRANICTNNLSFADDLTM